MGRRGLLSAIVGTVLALSGTTLIVVAIAGQRLAPQPAASAAGSIRPNGSTVERGPHAKTVSRPSLPTSKPVAIDIPVIGVHSSLQYLGLNPDGTVQVPSGSLYDVPAWYKYSPTPGSVGPSVIIGHVDSAASGPSVFFRVGELQPGNKVMVGRRDGSVAVFEITGVRQYPKAQFPTQLVYGNTKNAALRLITCGGSFNASTGHYLDNVIAFATLVSSH